MLWKSHANMHLSQLWLMLLILLLYYYVTQADKETSLPLNILVNNSGSSILPCLKNYIGYLQPATICNSEILYI